jgi:hypothetical protein
MIHLTGVLPTQKSGQQVITERWSRPGQVALAVGAAVDPATDITLPFQVKMHRGIDLCKSFGGTP